MGEEISVSNFLGEWTLIIGDVNTGKTTLAADILKALCAEGLSPRIAVIDLAPEISEGLDSKKKVKGAGGRLFPPQGTEVIYLSARLDPPRLSSRSEEEAAAKAEKNVKKVDELFKVFNRLDRDVLFVNDISMAVQAGTAEELVQQMIKASTLIANGYYGKSLGSGILSERERQEMDRLIRDFNARGKLLERNR